jgi:AcrR family transcriptional regulator
MNSNTIPYVKQKRRLTRRESQEATRERLIDAAEKAFIRHGFDASSVERIAEDAGFSRGAFYSNFRSKDELFIAVLKAKRQELEGALDEIVRRESDPAERLHAILDWYVNQEVNRGWMILETEFTLRACRNRAARSRMEEFNQQRVADYSALVATHFAESGAAPVGRPEAIGVLLFAAAKGLAEFALLDTGGNSKEIYAECRELVFRQLIPAAEEHRQVGTV